MFNSSPEISRNILFSNEEAKERKTIYNSACITNIINGIFNNLKEVSFLSLMKIKENNISAEDLTINEDSKLAQKTINQTEFKQEKDTHRESSMTRQLEGSMLNLLAASRNLTR